MLGCHQAADTVGSYVRRPLSGTNHRNLVLGAKVRDNVQCLPLPVPAEWNKCSSG